MKMATKKQLFTIALAAVIFAGCSAAERAAPKEPPYSPKFNYSANGSGAKIDVSVGLIAPQFEGDGQKYWATQKDDDVAKGMVRGMRTSFEALLTTKGFNTSGPFDSLDNMTFPEKKGCDFVLFPAIDVDVIVKASNLHYEEEGNPLTGSSQVLYCDMVLQASGAIQIIAKEPLSGEKMWIKRIDVSPPNRSMTGRAEECQGRAVSQELNNAWARLHEQMFVSVMKGLDSYVSPEEFQMLKRQAQELREKKAY